MPNAREFGAGLHPIDDVIALVMDAADNAKQLRIDVGGNSAGVLGVLATQFSVPRTVTLPNATDTLVGLATVDTLLNKTLTDPKIIGATLPHFGNLLDTYGNELIAFLGLSSAINHLFIGNSTGAAPVLLGTMGNDTNVDMLITARGTGRIYLGRRLLLGESLVPNGFPIATVDGVKILVFVEDVNAVNYFEMVHAQTGIGPILRVLGTNTNIDLQLETKGTGVIKLKANTEVTGDIAVTGTVDGRDVASDGTKLDGIESGAQADMSNGEIKTAYEANANTNEFSDAEQTKLAGIETAADITDAANVNTAGAVMETDLTTKGDLITRNATVVTRLGVGVNGKVLKANSAQSTGLEWVTRTIGEVTTITNPIVGKEYHIFFPKVAGTLQQVGRIVAAATSMSFTLRIRPRTAPFTGGVDVFGVKVATTTHGTDTAGDAMAANDVLVLKCTAVSGTPGIAFIDLGFDYD